MKMFEVPTVLFINVVRMDTEPRTNRVLLTCEIIGYKKQFTIKFPEVPSDEDLERACANYIYMKLGS